MAVYTVGGGFHLHKEILNFILIKIELKFFNG